MNIIYAIPSGQRAEKLLRCIEKWRKAADFKIAVTTWCDQTESLMNIAKPDYFIKTAERKSYAINHNRMAKEITGWDAYICGADDLYPKNNVSFIKDIVLRFGNKIFWVKDNLFNAQMTHPIITKGWYDKYLKIFEEEYCHNFCDTELFIRAGLAGEVVKCFQIEFDHRHYLKDNGKPDEIYKIGNSTYSRDRDIFNEKFKDGIPKIQIMSVSL